MPLYTYWCEKCGTIDLNIPIEEIDKKSPVTCPICEYNRYRQKSKEPMEFEKWVEDMWEPHPDPKKLEGHILLEKLIDRPASIRIR